MASDTESTPLVPAPPTQPKSPHKRADKLMRRLQAARQRILEEDTAAASVRVSDPPQSVDAAVAPDDTGAVEAEASVGIQ